MSRVQDQEEASLEEAFKLGFHHHLVQTPTPSLGHATGPPTNKGNQSRKWELFHLFKKWKLGYCVEGGQGKRKLALTKTRTEYEALPRSAPFLKELMVCSSCSFRAPAVGSTVRVCPRFTVW